MSDDTMPHVSRDDDQDAKISANAQRINANSQRIDETSAALAKQTELLQEILWFHKPWLKSTWKTKFRTKIYGPALKVLAVVTLWTGAIKTVQWYYNYCKIDKMGKEYVAVATRMFYEEANSEIALEFLDKAVKLCDGKAEYKFLKAYIEGLSTTRFLLNLGRPYTKSELDRAHRCLANADHLQQLEPNRAEPYLLQGEILMALKDYERAEKALAHALELDPQNDYAHVRMGQFMLERGKVEIASAEFEAAMARNPRSKWAWLWKGVLAGTVKKDWSQARTCYQSALSIDPKFTLALYNEGWTWAKTKQFARARSFMQRILRIDPAYKEALYAMGMFYGEEDNYPVAKTWLDKAIAADPLFVDAYDLRSRVNWEMKDYPSALADCNKAIHIDPMNHRFYRRRAKIYEKMGDTANAAIDLAFVKELQSAEKE